MNKASTDREIELKGFLHGGDYNPEQWLKYPDILEKDIEYMKKAHCNVVTLGVFSWAMLEREEGHYNFDWMEVIINNLYNNGISTILATPSGARPKWLSDKYSEVLRVAAKRVRQLFGARHNHCYTSPIYREKVALINHELGKRFAKHPGVIAWHISNEFGGECHCPLCQDAFREWLRDKYKTIDVLNEKWYTTFWSHIYNDFEQIESPSPIGESGLHGLNLDWKRFITHQTIDYMKHEISILRPYNEALPVTTNLMYYFNELNYFEFKDELDFMSWDTYPTWHKKSDYEIGMDNGMWHDVIRSIKKKPFLLMESTPSYTNWQGVSKPKKQGMHELSSLQAIAHGSESVMYFQWRQSRGASEKLHGAVIEHYGKTDTRVFREVEQLGDSLEKLAKVQGTITKSEIAILYDWENKWAIEDSQGPRNSGMHYKETVQKSYKAFRKLGLNIDFIDMACQLDDYKIVVVPMLYMFRSNIETKIEAFVAKGKTVIMTYWSGIVDENDTCFLGGNPYKLMDVFGLRRVEFEGLYDQEYKEVSKGDEKVYRCTDLCEVLEVTTAKPLMNYINWDYENMPAITRNTYKEGKAYYIGANMEQAFYNDFYQEIINESNVKRVITKEIPTNIDVSVREDESGTYIFVQNFSRDYIQLDLFDSQPELIFGVNENSLEAFGTNIYKYNG